MDILLPHDFHKNEFDSENSYTKMTGIGHFNSRQPGYHTIAENTKNTYRDSLSSCFSIRVLSSLCSVYSALWDVFGSLLSNQMSNMSLSGLHGFLCNVLFHTITYTWYCRETALIQAYFRS